MSLRLGDIAPDFEQDSSAGKIRFHEWLGDSWGVLFSHPADFTPVCTTELGFTAKLKDQFAERGVKAASFTGSQSGILTDGDVRRKAGADFAHLKVRDVMTASPMVVSPHALAAEALAVVSALRRHKTMSFRALVSDAANTLVVVARFLALLELFKEGSVRFEQVIALGELQITWVGSVEGEIRVSDEFDRPALIETGEDGVEGGGDNV